MKHDISTIWYASKSGNLSRLQAILNRKSLKINAKDPHNSWSSLHYAAREGHTHVIKLLCENNADPNVASNDGNNPLHLCAGWGTVDACRLLLEYGAHIHSQNLDKMTALEISKKMNRKEITDLLQSWKPLGLGKCSLAMEKNENLKTGPASDDLTLEQNMLKLKSNELGKYHTGNIPTLLKIIELHRASGRYSDAVDATRHALDIAGVNYGTKSEQYASLLNNVAVLKYEVGDYEIAKSTFKSFLSTLSSVKSKWKTTRSITFYENYALCLHYNKDYEESKDAITTSMSLIQSTLGDIHPFLTKYRNLLAKQYMRQNKCSNAINQYEEALKIESHVYGTDTLEVSTAYEKLGRGYFVQGEYKKSLTCFEKAASIVMRTLGANTRSFARIQSNVAVITLVLRDSVTLKHKIKRIHEATLV